MPLGLAAVARIPCPSGGRQRLELYGIVHWNFGSARRLLNEPNTLDLATLPIQDQEFVAPGQGDVLEFPERTPARARAPVQAVIGTDRRSTRAVHGPEHAGISIPHRDGAGLAGDHRHGILHDPRPDPQDLDLRRRRVHGGQSDREVGELEEPAWHILVHDVDATIRTDRQRSRFFGLDREHDVVDEGAVQAEHLDPVTALAQDIHEPLRTHCHVQWFV